MLKLYVNIPNGSIVMKNLSAGLLYLEFPAKSLIPNQSFISQKVLQEMSGSGDGHVMVSGSDETNGLGTTIEIKIKTLDSQTYTLQVDKCVPVPALKEQIALVTGILTEQQRLICRGKVLNDADLLSAYHVEDGHTLHLVVRQPAASTSENTPGPGTDSASASGQRQGSRGPGVLLGSFNFSEQDAAFPDFSRVVAAVLGSLGIPGVGGSGEEIDLNALPTERLSGTGPNQRNNSSTQQAGQGDSGTRSSPNLGAFARQTAESSESLQPPVIPDSVATLFQNLGRLRQEFTAIADEQGYSSGSSGVNVMDGQNINAASNLQRGLPTPADLANVMLTARQIINEQAAGGLLHLSRQLEGQANVTDASERARIQSHAVRSGIFLQNLGTMLLELGRTTMTVRMGDTPADAVVNAGPAVFLSSAGPNPIMVQPLPFQPGAGLGAFSGGSVQQNAGLSGGSAGSGAFPRNIDIRIRTVGSFVPSTGNRRDSNGTPNAEQGGAPAASDNGNTAQQGVGAGAGAGATGAPGNSAPRESEVRVIPLRTVIAAVPGSGARAATSDASRRPVGIIYPVLSRVQTPGNNGSSATRTTTPQASENGTTGYQQIPESAFGIPEMMDQMMDQGSASLFAEMSDRQALPAEIQRGLDQMFRSMFSGENPLGGGVSGGSNGHDFDTNFIFAQNSVIPPTPPAAAETVSASTPTPTPNEEGIFLSNILQHIIPMITENGESNIPGTSSSDAAHMVAEGNNGGGGGGSEQNGETGTSSSASCKRDEPETSSQPNAKRQKKE